MPLVLKRNFQALDDSSDDHVMSGELRVGRIYKRVTAGRPELQFLWAINGVYGGPDGMRVAGMTATLDQAQAELQENWEKWLAWASLQEISGTPPPQSPGEPRPAADSST
jgi:hypothetical protein